MIIPLPALIAMEVKTIIYMLLRVHITIPDLFHTRLDSLNCSLQLRCKSNHQKMLVNCIFETVTNLSRLVIDVEHELEKIRVAKESYR